MPPLLRVVTDQAMPTEVLEENVAGLGSLVIDWLNRKAVRQAGSKWQRYEFQGISCDRDRMLALWSDPTQAAQPAGEPDFTQETATAFVRHWLDNKKERPSMIKCVKDALATGNGGRKFIRAAFRLLAPEYGLNPCKRGPKGPRK
jgi:hypothetical protein